MPRIGMFILDPYHGVKELGFAIAGGILFILLFALFWNHWQEGKMASVSSDTCSKDSCVVIYVDIKKENVTCVQKEK